MEPYRHHGKAEQKSAQTRKGRDEKLKPPDDGS